MSQNKTKHKKTQARTTSGDKQVLHLKSTVPGEMAQWVKMPATKPGNLSLISKETRGRRKRHIIPIHWPLTSTHMLWHAFMPVHAHTNIHHTK